MKFLTYPSIEQLYKTLEVVEHGPVVGTEKLHGTNARVEFILGEGGIDVRYGSRNQEVSRDDDNAHMGFVGWAKAHYVQFRNAVDEVRDILGRIPNTVTFFGEWVGKGIQKGVNYYDGKTFYLFGIMVRVFGSDEVIILPYAERVRVAARAGLNHAPLLFAGEVKPQDALRIFDEIIARQSQVAADNGLESVIEGIVIEPAIPCLDKHGHPLLAKHKAEKFMEVAKAPREVSPDDEFIARVGTAFAQTFITEERVNHVLDQCRERGEEVKGDMSDMRFLVKAVLADVEKECADAFIFLDALVERKKASKPITRRIGNLYELMLRAAELEKHLTSV